MRKQIGWLVLKEDTEFTNTYECAAWYEQVLVPAGKYPLIVDQYTVRDDGEVSGRIGMAGARLAGTITSDEFGARFYGVPVGSYDNYQNTGKQSSYYFMAYLYEIAEDVLTGERHWPARWDYELLPEYEAKEIRFVSSIDYLEHVTHGIFCKRWYAVQKDREDDWSTGAFDLDDAKRMLKAQGGGLIAVIENGVCVGEITYEEVQ